MDFDLAPVSRSAHRTSMSGQQRNMPADFSPKFYKSRGLRYAVEGSRAGSRRRHGRALMDLPLSLAIDFRAGKVKVPALKRQNVDTKTPRPRGTRFLRPPIGLPSCASSETGLFQCVGY